MKEKGIETAVNIITEVNDRLGYIAYSLDIYGQVDTSQVEWFENLKKQLPDYICYCGCVDANRSVEVLQKYFALLFPTHFYTEGIPGTIIDAYAAGMHHMFRAIRRVMDEHSDVKAIYPIHMNPVVRQAADEELGGCDRIHIIEPLEVLDFHNFLARSFMILTDSGGIQEEAPSLGKPVLVMRDTTERQEGIKAGTLKLVGTDEQVIYENFKLLLEDQTAYDLMSKASNPYGDGLACKRIADILDK